MPDTKQRAFGRAGACCACSRCRMGGLFVFSSPEPKAHKVSL